MVGDHVILGTPTGSGKSLVALGLCFMAHGHGAHAAYYTAPIKALVSEKFFDLVDILGRENVGMITGDAHINAERAGDLLHGGDIWRTRRCARARAPTWAAWPWTSSTSTATTDRGWAWQVPLLTLPKAQFLLMSATLGDVERHRGVP